MSFQFDAVVMDIAIGFMPLFVGVLLLDVILIILFSRKEAGLYRLKISKPDYENQTIRNLYTRTPKFFITNFTGKATYRGRKPSNTGFSATVIYPTK